MSIEEPKDVDDEPIVVPPSHGGRLTPIRDRAQTPDGHCSWGRKFSKSCSKVTAEQAATSILDVHKIYSSCDLFDKCSSEFVRTLIMEGGERAVQGIIYDPNSDIVKQGTVGHSMYLLHRGEAEVLLNGSSVKVLRNGALFGEMNLLGLTAVRTATVRCVTICHLFEVRASIFVSLLLRFRAERKHFEKVAMARYRELLDHQKNQRKKMFLTQSAKMQEISPVTSKFQSRPTMQNALQGHVDPRKQKRKIQPQGDSPRSQDTSLDSTKNEKVTGRMWGKAREAAFQPAKVPDSELQDFHGLDEASGVKEDDEHEEGTANEKFVKRTSEAVFVQSHGYAFAPEENERTEFSKGSHLTFRVPSAQQRRLKSPKGGRIDEEVQEPDNKKEPKQVQKQPSDAHQRGSFARGKAAKDCSKYEVAEETFVQRVARSLREDTRRGCMMPAGGLRKGEDAGEDGNAEETDETAFLDPQLLPPVGLLSPSQKHSLLRQLRQQAHFKMKRGMAKITASLLMNKGNPNGVKLCN